jgi:hypothetical protein
MTPQQFTHAQSELGFDNHRMGLEIGLSQRMVAYMRTGERPISATTAGRVKEAIKRKIEDLKVLHKCIK